VTLAVDGRSGSGKTTLAAALAAHLPGAVVLHTDDISWYESFFGWDHLMAAGILLPLRHGEDVAFRPPAWDRRGRGGSITVSASAPVVIVEGVGSSRRGLSTLIDASVWVHADSDESYRRGIDRDGGTDEAAAFWAEWAREEQGFLFEDRPWERAAVIVCGTPDLVPPGHIDHGPQGELAALLGHDPAAARPDVLTAVREGGHEDLACRC